MSLNNCLSCGRGKEKQFYHLYIIKVWQAPFCSLQRSRCACQRDKRLNDCDAGAQSLWIKLTANSSMEETEVISSPSSVALSPYLFLFFNLLTALVLFFFAKLLKQRGIFHWIQRWRQHENYSVSSSQKVHLLRDWCSVHVVIVLRSSMQVEGYIRCYSLYLLLV